MPDENTVLLRQVLAQLARLTGDSSVVVTTQNSLASTQASLAATLDALNALLAAAGAKSATQSDELLDEVRRLRESVELLTAQVTGS